MRLLKRFAERDPAYITAEELCAAVETKLPGAATKPGRLATCVRHLFDTEEAHNVLKRHDTKAVLDNPERFHCEALADIAMMPKLAKQIDDLDPELRSYADCIISALGHRTVDDIVDSNSRYSHENMDLAESADQGWCAQMIKREAWLSILVSAAVLVNVASMGVSLDYLPGHGGWFVLELCCCLVYIVEVCVKMWGDGRYKYFYGKLGAWNTFDFSVTLVSVIDIIATATFMAIHTTSEETASSSGVRIVVILRVFRLLRIVRVVKLAKSPLFRDLGKMLAGCLLGVPSLFWVLMMLVGLLYVTGATFRILLGPAGDDDYIAMCGRLPDDVSELSDSTCIVHFMYGQEFFGTMSASMFTTFRFMLGDYSTRGGKSMVTAFAQGYGMYFSVPFTVWMIVVIFGVFNVITAVFVESTSMGLKTSGLKARYDLIYERKYVKQKCKDVIKRVGELIQEEEENKTPERMRRARTVGGIEASLGRKHIEPAAFMAFVADRKLSKLLQDLDIDVSDPIGLFDTCDMDNSGYITVEELLRGALKLRGEPQKSDIIAGFMALRTLQDKFDSFLEWKGYAEPLPREDEAREDDVDIVREKHHSGEVTYAEHD